MAKDELLEPQSPAMEPHIPRHGMSGRGRPDRTVSVAPSDPPGGATASEVVQGDERGTCVALSRSTRTAAGWPSGREVHGDGAVIVVRRRESRPHGEGPQVP